MRKLVVLLLALMLVGTVGCGTNKMTKDKEPTKKEVVQIEETVGQKDSTLTNDTIEETTVNSEDSNENPDQTSNKNETTTKPSTGNTDSNKKPSTGSTTKPSTGSSGNSGSTGNASNNTVATTPSKPAHTHSWTEVKETVVVQEAWVEDVFGWRTICGKCGLDMTEMNGEDLVAHSALICKSRYSNKYIKIDEIQHPAVTEERVTGYKCECGATKKK